MLTRSDNMAVKQYFNQLGDTMSPVVCFDAESHTVERPPSYYSRGRPCTRSEQFISQLPLPQSCGEGVAATKSVVHIVFAIWGEPRSPVRQCKRWTSPVFCNWLYQREDFHIDVMTTLWEGVLVYAFPPLALLSDVI